MEIVEIENIKTIENINETKSWLFEKVNKNRQIFSEIHQEKVRGCKSN